jgi:hypothetical protein
VGFVVDKATLVHVFLRVIQLFPVTIFPPLLHSSSLAGPEAYASAAPQPAGLLCNPDLDVPSLTTSLLYEILADTGGIIYRSKDVPTLSNQFRAATSSKMRKLNL